jgi:small nuclear ribonucleoprotein (snRNP)-like protein
MDFLESIVSQRVRVTISDGRQVSGVLHCVDNSCNLILANVEIRVAEDASPAQLLSSCMINGKDIIACELHIDDTPS